MAGLHRQEKNKPEEAKKLAIWVSHFHGSKKISLLCNKFIQAEYSSKIKVLTKQLEIASEKKRGKKKKVESNIGKMRK